MGFGWRLQHKENPEENDLYDLCFTHYNENEDPHSESSFYCNIPTGYLSDKEG